MKIFKQLLIIIAFSLIGVVISYLFSLIKINFPGSLIGMVILFIFLLTKLLKEHHIKDVATFFIDNMGIFFVPGAVAILNKLELISEIYWKLIIVILVGFIVSFTATYFSVKLVLFIQNKGGKKND
jgi:holin-like protein